MLLESKRKHILGQRGRAGDWERRKEEDGKELGGGV